MIPQRILGSYLRQRWVHPHHAEAWRPFGRQPEEVWGGENPGKFNAGYFYDPATNTWTGTTTTVGADTGELGLDPFEIRDYLSLKRHLVLSAVSFLFLAETNLTLRGKKPRVDNVPGDVGGRSAA